MGDKQTPNPTGDNTPWGPLARVLSGAPKWSLAVLAILTGLALIVFAFFKGGGTLPASAADDASPGSAETKAPREPNIPEWVTDEMVRPEPRVCVRGTPGVAELERFAKKLQKAGLGVIAWVESEAPVPTRIIAHRSTNVAKATADKVFGAFEGHFDVKLPVCEGRKCTFPGPDGKPRTGFGVGSVPYRVGEISPECAVVVHSEQL